VESDGVGLAWLRVIRSAWVRLGGLGPGRVGFVGSCGQVG